MDLSIVIPVYNEVENVRELAGEVEAALKESGLEWECLWVDDGSTDGTWDRLRQMAQGEPAGRHRLFALGKNTGQSAALWAGFHRCRGRFIATLDGDGQNDPWDIPRLLNLLMQGDHDLVQGYRSVRRDSYVRRTSSRIANAVRNRVTGKSVRDVGCATRVLRRECVPFLPPFKGLHRFLPTLLMYHGFRIAEAPVHHRPRRKGVTKYGIWDRLWVGLLDLVGVWWLRKRGFHFQVVRSYPEQEK